MRGEGEGERGGGGEENNEYEREGEGGRLLTSGTSSCSQAAVAQSTQLE